MKVLKLFVGERSVKVLNDIAYPCVEQASFCLIDVFKDLRNVDEIAELVPVDEAVTIPVLDSVHALNAFIPCVLSINLSIELDGLSCGSNNCENVLHRFICVCLLID